MQNIRFAISTGRGNALYFFVQGAYASALGLAVFGAVKTGKASPAALFFFQSKDWIFTSLDFFIFVWLIFGSRRLGAAAKRRGVMIYGFLGFFGLALYNAASLAGLSGLPQSLLLLAQTIPALVYLYLYAKEEWRRRPEIDDTEMDRRAAAYRITPREKEIIRLVGTGLSNSEIARRLFLSPQTVKNQIHALFQKLDVKNRVQLANVFRQAGALPSADTGSSTVPAKGDSVQLNVAYLMAEQAASNFLSTYLQPTTVTGTITAVQLLGRYIELPHSHINSITQVVYIDGRGTRFNTVTGTNTGDMHIQDAFSGIINVDWRRNCGDADHMHQPLLKLCTLQDFQRCTQAIHKQ